jgi:signal transduction histidine kinase
VLAAVAAIVTAGVCVTAYLRARDALEREFEQRLARIADTAAQQITPGLVAEVHGAGEESAGYLAIQVQLATLRAATGVRDASLIDSTRVTLADAGAAGNERFPSSLDSVAGAWLARSLHGAPAVSPAFIREGVRVRAAFAPVRERGRTVAVVAVEAEPEYQRTLTPLARRLTLIGAVSVAVIALFSALVVRTALSAARLEQRLSRAENLAAMGRLTATLAHEIKNPLAIIRGSAERIRRADPDTPRMAGFVIEESDRLSRTVSRYLQFARGGETGAEHGDAIAALEATLALLEGELASRRIVVERSPSGAASASVRLDPESLKQVYLNLLLNAMEAMPEGGPLRVSDRGLPDRIEVTIADAGQGMPPDVLRRVGTPFVTTKAQGSGLGLFLSRRLVESAGGALDIESAVGRGTTCLVRLPRAKG